MDVIELKKRYLGSTATKYDESRTTQSKWLRETEEVLVLLQDLQSDDLSILDIPCGTGRIIELLDEKGIQFDAYVGGDISEDMLAVSRSKIPTYLASKTTVTCADALTYQGRQDGKSPTLVLSLRFVNWLDKNHLEGLLENLKCSGAKRICVTNRSIRPSRNILLEIIYQLIARVSYLTWKRKQSLHDKSFFLAVLGAEWSIESDVVLEERLDATALSLLVFKKTLR